MDTLTEILFSFYSHLASVNCAQCYTVKLSQSTTLIIFTPHSETLNGWFSTFQHILNKIWVVHPSVTQNSSSWFISIYSTIQNLHILNMFLLIVFLCVHISIYINIFLPLFPNLYPTKFILNVYITFLLWWLWVRGDPFQAFSVLPSSLIIHIALTIEYVVYATLC